MCVVYTFLTENKKNKNDRKRFFFRKTTFKTTTNINKKSIEIEQKQIIISNGNRKIEQNLNTPFGKSNQQQIMQCS